MKRSTASLSVRPSPRCFCTCRSNNLLRFITINFIFHQKLLLSWSGYEVHNCCFQIMVLFLHKSKIRSSAYGFPIHPAQLQSPPLPCCSAVVFCRHNLSAAQMADLDSAIYQESVAPPCSRQRSTCQNLLS